jgi:hypothetical protein
MDRRDRPLLNHFGQSLALRRVQLGPVTRRLAVDQSIRPTSIEARHPVPNDLKRHSPDPSRIASRSPIIDLSQRQQAPRLGSIL